MTKLYDFRFTGNLVALSAISIVPPNSPIIKMAEGGKYNCVARQPIRDRHTGEIEIKPVIPSSTIRGKLRRAAERICAGYATERAGLTPYLYTVVGDVKSSAAQDIYDLDKRNERRARNPVIALYGAAVPWDTSRARVGHAIAKTDKFHTATLGGVRADPFQRNPDIADFVDNGALESYFRKRENTRITTDADKLVTAKSKALNTAIKGGSEAEIEKARQEYSDAKAALLDAKAESGNALMMPHTHESVAVGSEFTQEIKILRVTEAEIGLFLQALSYAFSQDPTFGGKANYNYGEVDAVYNVEMRESGNIEATWQAIGSFHAEPYDAIEFSSNFQPYIAAWKAYAEQGIMNLLVDGNGKNEELSVDEPKKPKKKAKADA